jgi:hypothetical protein
LSWCAPLARCALRFWRPAGEAITSTAVRVRRRRLHKMVHQSPTSTSISSDLAAQQQSRKSARKRRVLAICTGSSPLQLKARLHGPDASRMSDPGRKRQFFQSAIQAHRRRPGAVEL